MKKKLVVLQCILMFLFVTMNVTTSVVYAQDQISFADYTDEVFTEEKVSGKIDGQETKSYLFSSIGEKVNFTIHAEWNDVDGQDAKAAWKIVKVEEADSDSEALYTVDEIIADENIVFNGDTYDAEQSFELLETDYFIVIEGLTEETCFDYSFSFEPAITYATSISIPKSLTLQKGDVEELKVSKVKPSGAELGITWSSSNKTVAKVNAKTGEITAKKYGTAYIRAELQSGKVYQCKVYVEQPKLNQSSVTLLKGSKTKLSVSQTYKKVKYSSSDKSVAVVTAKGMVTAKGKGTAKITAQAGTKKLVCKIKVEEPKINTSSISLTAGKSTKLYVTGTTRKVKWHSSNNSVARVNSQGKVTSKGAGEARITGTIDGKTVVSCYIVVKAAQKKTTTNSVGSKTVYITKTGEKYHRYGCRYLRQSCIPISLNDAIRYGYDSCSVCY